MKIVFFFFEKNIDFGEFQHETKKQGRGRVSFLFSFCLGSLLESMNMSAMFT